MLAAADGRFEVEVSCHHRGCYALDVRYEGDLAEWPAGASIIVELR